MVPAEGKSSPRVLARAGGALYLLIIVLGLFEEIVVRERILVSGDAAATAANLRSMESLWRLGIASEFVLLICAITLLGILYVLVRPVGRDLARLAVFFNLVSIAIEATVAMYLIVALLPLGDAAYLKAFRPEELYALVSLSIRSHSYGFGVALIFFGCFCLTTGHLIFKSGFLPRVVGRLMQIAGLSYLVDSFGLILAPGLASAMFPWILLPALIGESSLALWLLFRGVDEEEWNARAVALDR